jgi:uncharacterized membrane protein
MMRGYGLYHGGGMIGGGGLGMLFAGFLWLLIIVGLVVLLVRMVRRSAGHGGMMHGMNHGAAVGTMPEATPVQDEAVAIARKRLAAGEITKEQFDALMQSLG